MKWFHSKIINKPLLFSIIMFDNIPVGVIRLEEVPFEEEGFEVYISVSEKYQNQGIAKSSLSLLRRITPNINIYANVLNNNANSIKLFWSSNFIEYKHGWYKRN